MVDSSSSTTDDKQTPQESYTNDTKIEQNINITISTNGKKSKSTLTSKQYVELKDKLLEIEQIKCEEYLISEQLNRLNVERQQLQNLINLLHTIDSQDRMTNSRHRQRGTKKTNSNL